MCIMSALRFFFRSDERTRRRRRQHRHRHRRPFLPRNAKDNSTREMMRISRPRETPRRNVAEHPSDRIAYIYSSGGKERKERTEKKGKEKSETRASHTIIYTTAHCRDGHFSHYLSLSLSFTPPLLLTAREFTPSQPNRQTIVSIL